MAIIKNIDELIAHVKLNNSTNFETIAPYVQDAQDKYLLPYVGSELLEALEKKSADDRLKIYLSRALAPFAMALATDELSINFGEAGHTVTRTEGLAPASDAKILRAAESQMERGWANMDRAMNYLVKNTSTYPEWKESEAYRRRKTMLFENAEDFQEDGMVDIDYSFLTFLSLRTLIVRVEKAEVMTLLPADLPLKSLQESEEDIDHEIVSALQAFAGSRVAAIHTSNSTRRQRGAPGFRTEFKPTVRPLYEDMDESGNYFDAQAEFWKARIHDLMIKASHKEEHRHLEFNSPSKTIFVAGARREKQ